MVVAVGTDTEVSGLPTNAYEPMVVTELGIVSEVSELLAKAPAPIDAKELGRVSEVSCLASKSPSNMTETALLAIDVTAVPLICAGITRSRGHAGFDGLLASFS